MQLVNVISVEHTSPAGFIRNYLTYYLRQEDYVVGSAGHGFFVCLSINLSFCLSVRNITQNTYEQIVVKFYEGVPGGKMNKGLNIGCNLDQYADCLIGNVAITQ